MRRVEVLVCEAIAHPSDLRPGYVWLRCENLHGDDVHGFTDLDQPDAYCVEHEAVVEIAALEMPPDRVDRNEDVLEAIAISRSRRLTALRRLA